MKTLAVKMNTLSGTNTELSGRNEHLTANNQKLEKRTLDLRNGLITMREGDIIFRAGRLLRAVLSAATGPGQRWLMIFSHWRSWRTAMYRHGWGKITPTRISGRTSRNMMQLSSRLQAVHRIWWSVSLLLAILSVEKRCGLLLELPIRTVSSIRIRIYYCQAICIGQRD